MLDRLLISSSARAIDPQFRNVTLLLHGDGSNGAQNNTFLDSSSNNFTITRNGNTTQGSFSPYGTRWSNYFDGSGDYLSVASNTALAFGTGDFTIEFWIYLNTVSGIQILYDNRPSNGAYNTIYMNGATLSYYVNSADRITSSALSANTWYHVAVSRSGTSTKMFVNGAQAGSTYSDSTNYLQSTTRIGAGDTLVDNPNGYICDLRVVKGTAVYTSNFTPPITPLTAISGTSLLTCQSNRLRDASTNNFAITSSGDVRVSPFSPYAPTAPYSAAVDGGSTYYDGNGDWLSLANNAAFVLDATFTLEAWVYPNRDYSTYQTIITKRAGDTPAAWQLYINITNGYLSYYNGSGYNSSTPVPLNQWSHVAAVYDGTNINLYLNGVRVLQSATTNTDQNTGVKIGYHFSSIAEPFQGYIADARIVKNAQVYSGATYTVPSAPLTAITGTSLLLRGTNAAIVDSAADNDLETVGNAQISTSVKKFGTGSIYFDGSGDYLTASTNPAIQMSGPFTWEAWVYPLSLPSSGNYKTFWSQRNTGSSFGGPLVVMDSAGNLLLFIANAAASAWSVSGFDTNLDVSLNQWQHLALVKNGTSITLYKNGVAGSSTTHSTAVGSEGVTVVMAGAADGTQAVDGYIDEFRISNGIARYTANFTPPAAPFPDQ